MTESAPRLVIKNPLMAFMHFCEVYCSGDCCGKEAFEIHPALLLARVAQENLGAKDGSSQFRTAWQQIVELNTLLRTTKPYSMHGETHVFGEDGELPSFFIPENDIVDWFLNWENAFTKASRYGGLDKNT